MTVLAYLCDFEGCHDAKYGSPIAGEPYFADKNENGNQLQNNSVNQCYSFENGKEKMMDNTYIILSNIDSDSIEDGEVQALFGLLQMSEVAFYFFSYSLTGKQILDELEKEFMRIASNIYFEQPDKSRLQFHIQFEDSKIKFRELDEDLFLYNIIESPQDHFAAVVITARLFREFFDNDNRFLATKRVLSVMSHDIRKEAKINNCAISEIYVTKRKSQSVPVFAEGIYFENEDLLKMFKKSKALELPYDTLLSPSEYQIPDWYKSMENQTAFSHSYTPPDMDIPTIQSMLSTTYTSTPSTQNTPMSESSGCYVATAVYGSYNCPEVWTLRRFRDYSLARSWYGRAFIRLYYAVSPTFVNWFGNASWFKCFWRRCLDQFVLKLNERGFDNTPYQD